LPGLTRQSISFGKAFVKIDGCPDQVPERLQYLHQLGVHELVAAITRVARRLGSVDLLH
jgi:hypothetical protein